MKRKVRTMQVKNKKVIIIACVALLIVALAIFFVLQSREKKENYVYKETTVQYGTLTVGVTESGTVDIGTVEQTFDLDMSALKRVETGQNGGSSNSGGMSGSMGSIGGMGGMSAPGGMGAMGGAAGSGGGMGGSGAGGLNMFSQMLGGGNNLVGAGDDSSLTVGKVLVSVGQQVAEGDALFELAEDNVLELEQELKGNVDKAKTDLDAVYADQKLSKQMAKNTYETSIAYGEYAETEYNNTIEELQDTVESSKITLEQVKTTLAEYENRLADIADSYEDAVEAKERFQYSLEHTEPTDAYLYSYYYDLTEQAQQTEDSLLKQKEQLESNVEQAKSNVETATLNYEKAKRNQAQGKLSAKQTLDLRKLAYDTAQETYDITLAYLEEDTVTQEEIYQETQEKWNEFSSYISGTSILAGYNGVITGVDLAEGDKISTGSVLVTLYDLEDVSMTVSVYEKDMSNIYVGSKANIRFTAYPEELYGATVSEVSDASTDSKGNVIYEVTITIDGDTYGLFQGMTGDITFITEQSEETLYVVRRAVIVEKDKSYVKIKDGEKIVKKEVTTGFTDGTYIQILDGLSEGDTVLIESKVSGS